MPQDHKNSASCRKYQLKKRYGITPEEYARRVAAVGGMCEICGATGTPRKKAQAGLAVDHCHKTNRIRGILCNRCNLGLGSFNDSPRLLSRAIRYLVTRGGRVTPCESPSQQHSA